MDRSSPITLTPSRDRFSFNLTLAYFQRRAGESVDRVEDRAYRRLLILDGSPALVEVRAAGGGSRAVCVRLLAGPCERLPAAAAAMRRSLGLDDDLGEFERAIAADSVLAALIERRRGLRLVRTQTPFEALIWAVIGQQITLTFAFRLKGNLVRTYGESLVWDGGTYWAFPNPERIVAAAEDGLAAAGLGRRKAATIRHVARLCATGELNLAGLATLAHAEAMRRLTALPGIGPWTAAYTLLRGLGDVGSCPVSDLGLRAAVGRLYDDGGTASTRRVAALAETWGDWAGYAAFYLWNCG